jgi:hypothetical protein
VADRAVVPVGVPGLFQRGRHLNHLRDLGAGEPLVEQSQGLVVQIGVQVALRREELHNAVAAPHRPVVGGELNVDAVDEQVDGISEVVGPDVRIAQHRATQGERVVQGVTGVLGHAQRTQVGEVVHLGGSLGARSDLEDDAHAIDEFFLARRRDLQRWGYQRDGAGTTNRCSLHRRIRHYEVQCACWRRRPPGLSNVRRRPFRGFLRRW